MDTPTNESHLHAYASGTKCSKCECTTVARKYSTAKLKGEVTLEYLECKCQDCGYVWLTKTADASK